MSVCDKPIAICGAESTLGKEVVKKLRASSVEIRTITNIDLRIPPPVLAKKLSSTKAVINLYGEPYVAKWKGRYEFDIYKSRLEALRAIGVALRYCEEQPEVFLTLSNAMVYDQFEVHDEYSIDYGDSFMTEVGRMETDEAIKIERQSFSGRIAIARSGYIMSHEGGAYPLLSKLARIGWGGRVDDGYQCLPMIHADDAVNAIFYIVNNPEAKGIFNLTIPNMASMNEMIDAFESVLGKNQHRMPKFLIKCLAGRALCLLQQNCKAIPRRLTEAGFVFKFKSVSEIVANLHSGIVPQTDALED